MPLLLLFEIYLSVETELSIWQLCLYFYRIFILINYTKSFS